MEWLILIITAITVTFLVKRLVLGLSIKPMKDKEFSSDDYCVIDIRDYIASHRSPYPGAENIPLSYLPRQLNKRFECTKQILLITDDKRGAKLAAKLIHKKRTASIYYIKPAS
ncbi:rhodanese-like domain-containing protein [Halobacillus rhizosphaerae]|uniref:rhodanese-like domain-containing protein n=1 Tax=Halobacillus rhizosphaerae TaxID=3064889 RepID=UPI00398B94F1